MSQQQDAILLFDPATGKKRPYPSHAGQYRKFYGDVAWLFNPWTRERRDPRDIASDVMGWLIVPPTESVKADVEPE